MRYTSFKWIIPLSVYKTHNNLEKKSDKNMEIV